MAGGPAATPKLPPPAPRSDGDLRFDFIAEDREGGRTPSLLTISRPIPIAGGRDFYCTFTLSGFVAEARNAYGATGLQALEHATRMSRWVLAGHEPAWSFHFSDGGPIDFTALRALD